jgi:DNA invertase Pin-like site-specific DNA recombinase
MPTQDPIEELKAERLQRRLGMEQIARELGREHTHAKNELASVVQTMREIVLDALEAGVPLDTYAKLVHVSRPTVYRWREDALKLAGRRQKVI